jgi:DNA-binding response OmpR family regulator
MTKNINALIVDDNMLFSALIETILSMLGIASKIASNGIEALQMLENEHFDLLITDFVMPRMNGLTLLKEVNRNKKLSLLKTILITGGGQSKKELNLAKELADQYLLKPFTHKELEMKVIDLNLGPLN